MPRSAKSSIRSDQVSNLAKVTNNNQVAVFIDAANLYYAGSKAGIRLSFERIAAWFDKHSAHTSLNFYTAFDPEGTGQLEFITGLEQGGYRIVKKPIKVFDTLTKGNMDIELAVDTLSLVDTYQVVVLMSGDGDFSYLVEHLKKLGKTTVVVSVGGFTSHELHASADHYFFLDRLGSMWQNRLKYNQQHYKVFLDTIETTDYPVDKPVNAVEKTPKPVHTKLTKLKLRLAKPREKPVAIPRDYPIISIE